MELNKKWARLTPVFLGVTVFIAACGGGNSNIDGLSNVVVHGSVYTETNDTNNQIVHFTRNADGTLTETSRIATNGAGTDGRKYAAGNIVQSDPLTSSNSLLITPDKQRLFAVNAGSNSVSSFAIDNRTGNLALLKTTTTSGISPVSLAYNNGILYVTYQQGENQVSAYRVDNDGALLQIGAYSILRANSLPTHVVVNPDGKSLIVNRLLNVVSPEGNTPSNTAVVFPINADGSLGTPKESTTARGLFSGAFLNGNLNNIYLLTEAIDNTLSEYRLNNGDLSLLNRVDIPGISGIPGVTAPCWLQVTPDNKFVFVATGSGHISSFALDVNGKTTLLKADAAFESNVSDPAMSSAAIDLWVSPDGKFLYQGFGGNDSIVSYAIGTDGSLTKIDSDLIGTVSKVSLQGLVGI